MFYLFKFRNLSTYNLQLVNSPTKVRIFGQTTQLLSNFLALCKRLPVCFAKIYLQPLCVITYNA